MDRILLRRAAVAVLAGTLFVGRSAAGPSDELLDRERAEEPFIVPTAIYSNEIDFGTNTRLSSDYLGEPTKLVADNGDLRITERDLYCFLLASGHAKPTLLDDYRKAKTPSEAEGVRREVRDAVRAYILTARLAAAHRGALDQLDAKRIDILTFPAWQVAWTMAELEPRVKLREPDLVREYKASQAQFYRPAEFEARVIWLAYEPPEPLREEDLDALGSVERRQALDDYRDAVARLQQEARSRLEGLRGQIEAGSLTFEEAAKQSSGPESERGGLLPPFSDGALAPQLEAALSQVAPGAMTGVVVLPGGVALARLEARRPARYLPFEAVRDDVRSLAERRALSYLFDRELRFVSPYKQTSDTRTWDDEPSSTIVVEADGFSLTKGEVLALFPELEATSDFTLKTEELRLRAKWLAASAVVRGKARAAGLEGNAIVARTREMAERIVRARRELQARLESTSRLSAEQAQAYFAEHPELFTPAPRQHLVQIVASAKEEVPVSERGEVARLLVENFIDICRRESEGVEIRFKDAERVEFEASARRIGYYREPKFREGEGDDQYTYNPSPGRFPFAALMPYAADAVRLGADEKGEGGEVYRGSIDFVDLGYTHTESLAGVAEQVRGTEVGAFSPIATWGGLASSFFVMDEQRPSAPDFDDIRPYVTRELALEQRTRIVSKLLDSYLDGSTTRYLFE